MKRLTILILTIMTSVVTAKETAVYELVVYKIKSDYASNYQNVLTKARQHIQKLPGFLDYQTFRSAENNRVFMDLIKWSSLEEALDAAKKVEQMKELADFMKVFEEVKFMDHFESFASTNTPKLDLMKVDKTYYSAKTEPSLVTLKPYRYLMINGISAPEDAQFLNAIEAIYAVAYGVKFRYKSKGKDFVVPKMEAQWWTEGPLPYDQTPRDEWHWNIVIPMPEFVEAHEVEGAVQAAVEKKQKPQISEVEFKPLNESRCVQVLHLGSYEDEKPTVEKIVTFAANNGLEINGHHREIYITDPMKTTEEKLKTIIRYPVK